MTDLIDREALDRALGAACDAKRQTPRGCLDRFDLADVLRAAPAVCCERCGHWKEWKPGASDCDEEWCGYSTDPETFGCTHFKEAQP